MGNIAELHEMLDLIGVKKSLKNKWLAENTGYSRTQVQDIMAGRKKLSERFWKLAIDAIKTEQSAQPWKKKLVESGMDFEKEADKFIQNELREKIFEMLRQTGVNDVCLVGLKELLQMPASLQFQAVNMLKQMNEGGQK